MEGEGGGGKGGILYRKVVDIMREEGEKKEETWKKSMEMEEKGWGWG